MEFRTHTLENGLDIVAECNPHAYSTAIGFFVKTGARDETPELSGVSHFLEHMVFKGTPTRSAADVNREIDEMGSHSNAFTSEEQTVYYATVLPELQDRAVDLLGDILRPSLRDDDFNTEKQVILEEIHKYDDEPPFGAHERAMELHFAGHPLQGRVLGTIESVSALTPEAMRSYFEQRYSPGNITLAAAGNVDFDQLIASAERVCGSWLPVETTRQTPPAPNNNGRETIAKDLARQQYVIQVANGPHNLHPRRYAARLLGSIVGDDSGSRIFWKLVDTGKAEYAGMRGYEYEGTGLWMSWLSCTSEDLAENLKTLEEIKQEVDANGVEEDELRRAITKTCAGIVLQSERPTNRLFTVGNSWISRREYRTVREAIESYQKVTLADIAAIGEEFPLAGGTTVVVGPKKPE